MIEYPKCADNDCWYLGHTDRLNEYDESYKAVDNDGEVSRHCDVCIDNINVGICDICDKYLLETWILLDDTTVCARCVGTDNILDYIYDYEEIPEDEDLFDGIDLEDLISDYKDKVIKYPSGKEIRFSQVLRDLIEKARKDRVNKEECKNMKIKLRFDSNCDIIRKIMKVTDDCAKRVTRSLDEGVEVPDFNGDAHKRSRLLLWLQLQKRE